MELKEKIEKTLKKVKRKGMKKLIKYLKEETDYFTAPASTKYHLAKEQGLAIHSWNVYENLKKKAKEYKEKIGTIKEETIIICGLLHDICKINTYKETETKGIYKYEKGKIPIGHGTLSVTILQKYINLTEEEICAIRWHMNAWEPGIQLGTTSWNFKDAKNMYPIVILLFTSDYEASEIIEKGE